MSPFIKDNYYEKSAWHRLIKKPAALSNWLNDFHLQIRGDD